MHGVSTTPDLLLNLTFQFCQWQNILEVSKGNTVQTLPQPALCPTDLYYTHAILGLYSYHDQSCREQYQVCWYSDLSVSTVSTVTRSFLSSCFVLCP